jgi:hypothetical protein
MAAKASSNSSACRSRVHRREGSGSACSHDDIGLETDQFGCQNWQLIVLSIDPPVLDKDVFTVQIA